MREIKLADIDLNLLYIFHVLIEELNVTKAAQRLNVSQPAVSRSLARLRESFNDPLFIRTSHGLSPTARTESISPYLVDMLKGLENLIQPPEFDPATTQRRFVLSTTDFGALTVLSKILDRFYCQAPNAIIEVRHWEDGITLESDMNAIDIALAVMSKEASHSIRAIKLDMDDMVCVARADHPELQNGLTLDNYVNSNHVKVVLGKSESTAVDRELERMGYKRHVSVVLPTFFSAVKLISNCDLILTVPRLFAMDVQSTLPNLKIHDLPINTRKFNYSMLWHERYQFDLGHQWLRSLIRDAFISERDFK